MKQTDQRLLDVLNGREDNYLLPFYWQHGNHRDRIPEQIKRIYDSGCRALCVESRPHPNFCGDTWWADMDVIFSECESLGMKVWLLDDKKFPTGYANGAIAKKYPELRSRMLIERHVDVMGPMKDASVLVKRSAADEDSIIGVYAFPRLATEETLSGEPIDLSANVKGSYLYWDIPDGCYRIFFLYRSRRGGRSGYIDMIDEHSVDVLLREVYEPHYERYKKHFGNTFAGFFSDEPCFGNSYAISSANDYGFYDRRMGHPHLALPYNENLLALMNETLGENPLPYLVSVWYEHEKAPAVRHAYMDGVSRLYRDCFCRRLGDWCRAHGVLYIGHVIEDMNCHARLGYGTAHYFRALDGQDMSGIDIVLHQVMPGFAHYEHSTVAAGRVADGVFYHYVLGQLAASLSHIKPRMKGRAMCEVFGAYGWGEGAPMMRWLMDFLLVRGVNRFVPHAFSPTYPDPDCPPHFGAEGHDPQYDGFSALMRYANQAAHLLSDGIHQTSAAILYHAEGEWMSPHGEAMYTQKPARELLDHHIAYDILPADALTSSSIENGKLTINGESYGALIVPYARNLPDAFKVSFEDLNARGFPVLMIDALPEGWETASLHTVPLEKLAETVISLGLVDITVEGEYPLLRHYHTVRGGVDVFMFFNESASLTADTTVHLPVYGEFARLRLLEDERVSDSTENGDITLRLLPGQSEILVFGSSADLPKARELTVSETISPTYTVEIADADDLTDFRLYTVTDTLFPINAPDRLPDFSGKMRYTFELDLKKIPKGAVIDLGKAGETARLWVNGESVGIRIAAPYRFSIENALHAGKNTITVEVANTLCGKIKDDFSYYLQIQPAGLLGPITLLSEA